jgi:hypothetical protein
MTVIATMLENERSILHPSETPLKSKVNNKLQKHDAAPLAWGTAGSMNIGIDRFGEWLKHYQWPPTDWASFETEVANKLSELNAEEKEYILLAKAKPEYYDVANALVVGWLNGSPRILELTCRGTSNIINENFYAIGSGGLNAKIIDKAFDFAMLNKPPLEKLRLNLKVVCETDLYCAEPIHIWRVEPDGITELN